MKRQLQKFFLSEDKSQLKQCNDCFNNSIEIPESITRICRDAFYNNEYVERIKLPYSLVRIDPYAFRECKHLNEVIIPCHVKYLSGFMRCLSLKKINIPSGVQTIGRSAFCYCVHISHFEIPDSVTKIEEAAFECCYSIDSIDFPDSITEIDKCVCWHCHHLKEVKLPNEIKNISEYSFCDCYELGHIDIPETVETIGRSAFGDTAIKSVKLPGNLRVIESAAFSHNKIVEISLPNTLEYLAGFNECYYLKNIDIPSNVNTIGEYAFRSCYSLTNVKIPEGVTQIKEQAFKGCIQLQFVSLPMSLKRIDQYAFSECINLRAITSLIINPNDIEINPYAFDCTENKVILYVPDDSVDSYKSDSRFAVFQIKAISTKSLICDQQFEPIIQVNIDEYISQKDYWKEHIIKVKQEEVELLREGFVRIEELPKIPNDGADLAMNYDYYCSKFNCDAEFIFNTEEEKNEYLQKQIEYWEKNKYTYENKWYFRTIEYLKNIPSIELFCKKRKISVCFDKAIVKDYLKYKTIAPKKIYDESKVTIGVIFMAGAPIIGGFITPFLLEFISYILNEFDDDSYYAFVSFFEWIGISEFAFVVAILIFGISYGIRYYKKKKSEKIPEEIAKINPILEKFTEKLGMHISYLKFLADS